jgi:hypothetical protein
MKAPDSEEFELKPYSIYDVELVSGNYEDANISEDDIKQEINKAAEDDKDAEMLEDEFNK